MAKKYYLTVDQRKRIINAVLGDASKLEIELPSITKQAIRDLCEEGIQANRLIATLLKVEDGEED